MVLSPHDGLAFTPGCQVARGYLLGVQPPAHQLFAVVKHEGSEEHA